MHYEILARMFGCHSNLQPVEFDELVVAGLHSEMSTVSTVKERRIECLTAGILLNLG
jgi:hypothetical protein